MENVDQNKIYIMKSEKKHGWKIPKRVRSIEERVKSFYIQIEPEKGKEDNGAEYIFQNIVDENSKKFMKAIIIDAVIQMNPNNNKWKEKTPRNMDMKLL